MGDCYAPVETPWVAVRMQKTDSGEELHVIGLSEDLSGEPFSEELLSRVRTLIVCSSTVDTAAYQSTSGLRSTGSTEVSAIRYYRVDHDGQTLNKYVGGDSVSNELPKVSQNTPQYTVTDTQILKEISGRIASRTAPCLEKDYFRISKDGVLYGTSPTDRRVEYIVIPDTVRRIEVFAFQGVPEKKNAWTHATAEAVIPATVEEIADGAFQYMNKDITLIVEPGSCGERYAVEQGMNYRYPDDE